MRSFRGCQLHHTRPCQVKRRSHGACEAFVPFRDGRRAAFVSGREGSPKGEAKSARRRGKASSRPERSTLQDDGVVAFRPVFVVNKFQTLPLALRANF